MLAFGLIGSVLLVFARAAPNAASFEAENASLTGAVRAFADATASNNSAIEFGLTTITLPTGGSWTNVTSNLSGMSTNCGNLTTIAQVPGADRVIAGLSERGLYVSTNGGSSWSALGTGSGSDNITNRPRTIVFDPTDANRFWVAGIYGPGVFKTTNGGTTFQRLGTITHNDSVSVDFTDPNRQTLLAGGHEQGRTVYKSSDGGQTWTNIGGGIAATGFTTDPIVINSQTYLANANPDWGGGSPGIFRTTNGGSSWQQVSSEPAGVRPLITSDGTIYWSLHTNNDGLMKSTNGGASWTKVGTGLKYEISPIELPDGRLVSINANNRLVVSADDGNTWTVFGAALPFGDAKGVRYNASRNAFFIWRNDCNTSVPSNAVQRLP